MPTNPERARDARHAIAEIITAHGGQWSGQVFKVRGTGKSRG